MNFLKRSSYIFPFLGILLHKTPRRFLNAVMDAVKGAGGIIVQFPFYAGIMGGVVISLGFLLF